VVTGFSMNKKIWGLLLLIVVLIGVGVFTFSFRKNSSDKLISPWISGGRVSVNQWLPQVLGAYVDLSAPNITATSAYFVDVDTGMMLYQKDPHNKRPVASLTKVMTALIALENHSWEDQILISDHAASMEPDHMELKSGEQLSVEELMYGIFLISANDAAEALAEQTLGSRENFLREMNDKAKQLGMSQTWFINPTGLEEDDNVQYSSAYDVALMSRYLIRQFPKVLDISSTYHYTLPSSLTHQDYDFYSGINLVTTYPGVVGLKTGYTPEAGLTLVTVARREGHTVMGVLLNSSDRRNEARELLDLSFEKLGVTKSSEEG
jgi:serine-type D-Ala-D-Ala carboxypeptidase (penicillin-binding protein 5/6)